jgi:hypothetical protein
MYIELLETKLNYELCLKNISNTVNNRYKGNHLTMKDRPFLLAVGLWINTKIKNLESNKKIWHALFSTF